MLRKALLVLLLSSTLFTAGIVVAPAAVQAASSDHCSKESFDFLRFPTWYKYLDPQFVEGECRLSVEAADGTIKIETIAKIMLAVFEIMIRISGILAVAMVVYGGFQYILSQGDVEKVKGSRRTIVNSLIGVAIALSATAIVNLIARNIT